MDDPIAEGGMEPYGDAKVLCLTAGSMESVSSGDPRPGLLLSLAVVVAIP